jgi:hypothetical protein
MKEITQVKIVTIEGHDERIFPENRKDSFQEFLLCFIVFNSYLCGDVLIALSNVLSVKKQNSLGII